MNRLLIAAVLGVLLTGCAGVDVRVHYPTYSPRTPVYADNRSRYHETGIASYYADKYQGRLTANGVRFHQGAMTAAHKSLPFGTHVRVVNRDNGRSVVVHINDRGLFIRGRIIDFSYAAFSWIEHPREGLADVVIEVL